MTIAMLHSFIMVFSGLFSCDSDFMCWPEHLYATIQLTNCDNAEDGLGLEWCHAIVGVILFGLVWKTINLIHIKYTRGKLNI